MRADALTRATNHEHYMESASYNHSNILSELPNHYANKYQSQHTMISRSTLNGAMRVAIASATARIAMNTKTKTFETSKMIKKIPIKDKMVKKFKILY